MDENHESGFLDDFPNQNVVIVHRLTQGERSPLATLAAALL